MTAIAEGRERAAIGRAERIGTLTIVNGAARRLWAGGWRTLALWGAIGVFGWGLQIFAKAIGVNPATPGATPAHVAYLVLAAAGSGVGAALSLRLFARGPERWLAIDRPLLAGGAAMGGFTLFFGVVSLVYTAATRGAGTTAAGVGGFIFALGNLVALYVALRLTLWPVALVMGRTVSLRAAWRLMRKATRGAMLGYIVFSLPFILAMATAWTDLAAGRQPEGWRQVLFMFTGALYGLAAYGMAATIYALRVENPATVADVFD